MSLVQARAETIRRGDLVATPKRLLLMRVTDVRIDEVGVTIIHEKGTFAPVALGERLPVMRARAPGVSRGTETAAGPPEPRPLESTALAGGGRPAAASPVSPTRARVLANVLMGFRWPGEAPKPGSRRARAAEQVARFALESLSVVE